NSPNQPTAFIPNNKLFPWRCHERRFTDPFRRASSGRRSLHNPWNHLRDTAYPQRTWWFSSEVDARLRWVLVRHEVYGESTRPEGVSQRDARELNRTIPEAACASHRDHRGRSLAD